MFKRIFIFVAASFFMAGAIAQDYTEIKTTQLPKKVTEYFKKNLAAATMVRAAKTVDKGIIKYAVVAEMRGGKSIYVFDKDGNFLNREKTLKTKVQPSPAAPAAKKTDAATAPVKK